MLFLAASSVASHSGRPPPPGSHPITRTLPSQVKAAECQRPPEPAVRMPVVGPASGSRRSRLAPAGVASGTAMTSMKSPTGSSLARVPSTQPELLELLLYTIRLPAEIPATVRVCDPQGSVTDATRCGSLGLLMSKTCTPSQPAGTVWPSQVLASGFLEFQDRTRRLFHTTMSPWSPLQCCQTTSCGLSGSELLWRTPSGRPSKEEACGLWPFA